MNTKRRILLTTSDYLPQLGGLSTYTNNIETVLRSLEVDYEVFHWKSLNEIKKYPQEKLLRFEIIINIHFLFGFVHRKKMPTTTINMVHGSEILFTSPNWLKHLLKVFLKRQFIKYFCNSYLNLFISEFTFKKLISKGLLPDYGRDIIIHNCIKTVKREDNITPLKDEFIFICVARDVPHKNITGCIKFCELVKEVTNFKVTLYLMNKAQYSSTQITLKECNSISNRDRDLGFMHAHFNLLLSKDHSKHGFFEGFGLTVLEAAQHKTPSIVLNSGGLSEAVHDQFNGHVIQNISSDEVKRIFSNITQESYIVSCNNAYNHVLNSHSLEIYKRLFKHILRRT